MSPSGRGALRACIAWASATLLFVLAVLAVVAPHGIAVPAPTAAAEMAAEHMAAFARLAQAAPAHLFALYHDATLGSPEVRDFLAEANPDALAAMEAIFAEFGIVPEILRNSPAELPA